MILPESNHVLAKTKNVLIRPKLTPVKPSCLVVLVVGIVVAELSVQELIAGPKHWNAIRQHEQAEKVLDLLASQRQHVARLAFIAFVTTVPAMVGVHAILVIVTIRPVAFLVVRDQVIQGEAVV